MFSFLLTKLLLTLMENPIEVILVPANIWRETSPFPNTINLVEGGGASTIAVSLESSLRKFVILVLLMGDTHLMLTNHLIVTDFSPFLGTDEVLCLDLGVSEDVGVRGYLDEVVGGHSFPKFIQKGAVVNLSMHGVISTWFMGREVKRPTRTVGATHFARRFQSLVS